MSTSTVCRAAVRQAPRLAITTRAMAMAFPTMLAAVRSVQTAAAHSSTSSSYHPLGGMVDWEKIKRDQERRARLAQHATAKPASFSSANQVDWDRIKNEQARRHRLATHATAHLAHLRSVQDRV